MLMSAVEIRTEINSYLKTIEDERFLKAVHAMLDTYVKAQKNAIEGYDLEGNPKTANELMDKYEAGIAAVEAGDFITVEGLREKSKEWLSPTK